VCIFTIQTVNAVAPMKKRYDVFKSVKNPYLRKSKKQLTIRVDEQTNAYFRLNGRLRREVCSLRERLQA